MFFQDLHELSFPTSFKTFQNGRRAHPDITMQLWNTCSAEIPQVHPGFCVVGRLGVEEALTASAKNESLCKAWKIISFYEAVSHIRRRRPRCGHVKHIATSGVDHCKVSNDTISILLALCVAGFTS